jgi:hypothetical protein
MNLGPAYNDDHYAWTKRHAELIREGRLSEIDTEHLAEELESMSGSERRELISRFTILLAHLLKWQFQPLRRGTSWQLTVMNQRDDIEDLLEQSPSLRGEIDRKLDRAYTRARRAAAIETGQTEDTFPKDCPYTFDEAMKKDFWPE